MYRFIAAVLLATTMIPFAQASIGQASSKQQKAELDIEINTFAEQRERIVKELANGETYSEISSADRAKVKDALNRIESQLELSGGVEGLSAEQKANVFNDQELINTLLTKASDDSRLVCRREKKVGSHRPITECMTVAERHRAYENAQKAMRDVRVPTLKAR